MKTGFSKGGYQKQGRAHLQRLNEDVFWDQCSASEEAGHVGGSCRAGDGRHVGAGQLPQQQLHQAHAAVLWVLHKSQQIS